MSQKYLSDQKFEAQEQLISAKNLYRLWDQLEPYHNIILSATLASAGYGPSAEVTRTSCCRRVFTWYPQLKSEPSCFHIELRCALACRCPLSYRGLTFVPPVLTAERPHYIS